MWISKALGLNWNTSQFPKTAPVSFCSVGTESILRSFIAGGVPSPIYLPGQQMTYVAMAMKSGRVSRAQNECLGHQTKRHGYLGRRRKARWWPGAHQSLATVQQHGKRIGSIESESSDTVRDSCVRTYHYPEEAENHSPGQRAPVLMPLLRTVHGPRLRLPCTHPVYEHEEDACKHQEGKKLQDKTREEDLF